MRKVITAETEYVDFGSQVVLHVLLNEATSKDLCLALMLLKDQLVHRLDLKFQDFALQLTMGEEKHSYCQELRPQDKQAEVLMTPNAVLLLARYLLKYYRDGFAEVDHIDMDFICRHEREFTIVFKAELSR